MHQRALTTVSHVVHIPVTPHGLGEAFLRLVATIDALERGWHVTDIAVTLERDVSQS